MISVLLGIATIQSTAPARKTRADDVVVVGRRLKTWRSQFSFRDGRPMCKTKVSTGDKQIDEIGCQAMRTCLPLLSDRIAASELPDIEAEARHKMEVAIGHDLSACLQDRYDVLIAELVDSRYERKYGKSNAAN